MIYLVSILSPKDPKPCRPPPAEVVTEAIKVESSRPEDEVESHGMKIINEIISVHQCVLAEGGLTNRLDQFHAFKAIADPDTRYYHQVLGEPSADQFTDAVMKEWIDQSENKTLSIMLKSQAQRKSNSFLLHGKRAEGGMLEGSYIFDNFN